MPKRTDLHTILLIGSGPIVIGQACEFDYSGTQACKALREEGYRVVLVNSNPATIMTDPMMADATYVEPLTVDVLTEIIKKERPDALLPTLGGQTALNLAKELSEQGILQKHGVQLIGANYDAIHRAESRSAFKETMEAIGVEMPASTTVESLPEALLFAENHPYPFIIRPSFTLGGIGGGIAHNEQEFRDLIESGLDASPVHQVLIDESILGWKEYELEVMRDNADNVVIICSIENLDPMGVHTGDSITVAPAQTLTDVEYQAMRDTAKKIIRAIGVETGGSNIQFAVHPKNGRLVVIEMNPRVSRSSALASKATGFPIAKIAAKLAIGYTLDELPNDITQTTPACFEPTIDYVVTKIPRFAFEKFPEVPATLSTTMKSVGEVMAIGRTFKESLGKALRSLERKASQWEPDKQKKLSSEELLALIEKPTPDRIFHLYHALLQGIPLDTVAEHSSVDRWFLAQLVEISTLEQQLQKLSPEDATNSSSPSHPPASSNLQPPTSNLYSLLLTAKQHGFSDHHLAQLWKTTEETIRNLRSEHNIAPNFKIVDTCAGEFPSYTPYYYSTYDQGGWHYDEEKKELRPITTPAIPANNVKERKKSVIILGSGPNRIGQGIEFDYCCVHASYTLQEMGYDSVMVNCNPETVSTDYDTSTRLYFEPVTVEDVLAIVAREQPEGVIAQFGGQTPLNIAAALEENGVTILGTSLASIDLAEDRKQFATLLEQHGIAKPAFGTAHTFAEAKRIAADIGYPIIARPSYVLGGRAMEIVYAEPALEKYMQLYAGDITPNRPMFVDQFLQDAMELDVDALCDGKDVYIAGIMQHIEEAGIHSGDSACVLPPESMDKKLAEQVHDYTITLAKALNVRGCLNIQMAVRDGTLYVLEVNPRASRTVPFVSKATGIPLITHATKLIMGATLADLGLQTTYTPPHFCSVKEVVLPFVKFTGSDTVLGPEMKSTGEVMGIAPTFAEAYAKAELAAGVIFPKDGNVFVSVADESKDAITEPMRKLCDLGYTLIATKGTAEFLKNQGITTTPIAKASEDDHDNVVTLIKKRKIGMVINIPSVKLAEARTDGYKIRTNAVRFNIPLFTTIPAVHSLAQALNALTRGTLQIHSLQSLYQDKT